MMKTCLICGNPFKPYCSKNTCSAECRAIRLKRTTNKACKTYYWKDPDKARERMRSAYQADPAKHLAVRMDYYWRCAELERARCRHRYWRNPEKSRARVTQYRWDNLERRLIAERESYRRHAVVKRQKMRAWSKANPENCRARTAKRNCLKVINGGNHTPEEALAILKAQRYRCIYCPADLRKVRKAKDHKIALARGGSNAKENIQWLCWDCNARKHAKDAVAFAQERGLLL